MGKRNAKNARKSKQLKRFTFEDRSSFHRVLAMKQVINAMLAMLCLAFVGLETANCQPQSQPLGPQPGAAIGFRNETKMSIVVQGHSVVNNQHRRGQPILLSPGKIAFDANLPAGTRFFTIYDSNQTSRIMMLNQPVTPQGKDLFFTIRMSSTNPSKCVFSLEVNN